MLSFLTTVIVFISSYIKRIFQFLAFTSTVFEEDKEPTGFRRNFYSVSRFLNKIFFSSRGMPQRSFEAAVAEALGSQLATTMEIPFRKFFTIEILSLNNNNSKTSKIINNKINISS